METIKADLHVHTTFSDGSFKPAEVVRYAKKIGLGCIGICDHDNVRGIAEAVAEGAKIGIEVIAGVEVSAEEEEKEIHMLGYFIDYKSIRLNNELARIRDDRKARLAKMVARLNSHGFNMNAKDIENFAGDVSISRLHVAQYMASKGLVSSWKEAFKKYIGDDKPCYVASFRLSARQAIDIIKSAGGVAVIAHPALNKVDSMLGELIEHGIDGIEVFHPEHTRSVCRHYEEFAKKHKLLITGGSDCHGSHKGEVLMGRVTLPYSYVEALRELAGKKSYK